MKSTRKGAPLDFKRALVRLQKGLYCNSIKPLFKAKRAYIGYEPGEKSLQLLIDI